MRNPLHPGEIVRTLIIDKDGLGMSVSGTARKMEVDRSTLHRILNGTSKITKYTAKRLSILLPNTDKDFWLDVQQNYDFNMVKMSE